MQGWWESGATARTTNERGELLQDISAYAPQRLRVAGRDVIPLFS